MKIVKIWDGPDPGGTPGKVFTSSIGLEEIIAQDAFLDHINIGLKGAVSTGAVAIETFAGLLSEYNLSVGPETRIQMNATELVALMAFYYKELPFVWENTDNTGNDFIGNIKVPLHIPAEERKPITHSAERTTQTNIGTETIAVSGSWLGNNPGRKPIHAVKIALTTAAATGYDLVDSTIAKVGKLVGLIVKQANPFSDANIDISVQRVKIVVDGQTHSTINLLGHYNALGGLFNGVEDPITDLLKNYHIIDLRDEGIDTKGQEVKVELDVEDASDSVVIIPIIEME